MDLIDRNVVLKLPRNVTKNLRGEVIEETIDVDRIKRLPSVQPEIIRCKDCVKFHEPTCLMAYDGREWADYMGFCHGGERDADGSDR